MQKGVTLGNQGNSALTRFNIQEVYKPIDDELQSTK